ncbi:Actin cross-linking toxin VgrG1 [BD1-7 clade bacterium]|uniref:Actin cross-linking toxin VgrG1 n=1 Tax=BD1-7 clade bacterium TaxID=2029982 RepID=A0A5S9QB60_9GAMM|nr:Actin cross-linking toxin VgrG1 [BD1-7 clade bacterium]CAA0114990.1 Actin cross-linking toxin VgrG1 [BD1-7 clade bacterium]
MADSYTQKQRPLLVYLDSDGPFIGTYLDCQEQLSGDLTLTVEFRSEKEIAPSVLAKPGRIEYQPMDSGKREMQRCFSGLIADIEHLEVITSKDQYRYRVSMCDPLSMLEYRRHCQIFQSQETRAIVEQVFKDAGLSSYLSIDVQSPGVNHEYCVQFDETDAAFVRRMLASEGWHYHLDISAKQPKLLIGDSNQIFKDADPSSVPFSQETENRQQSIFTWHNRSRVSVSNVIVANHSQELAEYLDSGARQSSDSSKQSDLEEYHYADGQYQKEDVRAAAKTRMESYDTNKNPAEGECCLPGMAPGYMFKLEDHPVKSNNSRWLITHVHHRMLTTEDAVEREYQNRFSCVPTDLQWRPEPMHKPRLHSLQSAEVTGPDGKETNQDKMGRIKVKFDWDTKGESNEKSSCWIPVCQSMAGNGMGVQFVPRIGDAVLVAFIDGDPDRPVVAGSLFNGKHDPVYDTPTQAGIRSRSTPDGNSDNYNEIRFEDKKDSEELYMQAEKDMNLLVKNDLGAEIQANLKTTVDKKTDIESKEDMSVTTDAQMSLKSSKDMSLESDQNLNAKASQDVAISATSNVSVDGQQIKISGQTKIELSVGSNSISISPSGVEISAMKVSISGQTQAELKGAMVTVQGQATADLKGAIVNVNGDAMTNVKAGAMVQVQGGITKIN